MLLLLSYFIPLQSGRNRLNRSGLFILSDCRYRHIRRSPWSHDCENRTDIQAAAHLNGLVDVPKIIVGFVSFTSVMYCHEPGSFL